MQRWCESHEKSSAAQKLTMQIELLSGRTSYFSFEEDRYLLMFTAVCIDAFSIRTIGEKKPDERRHC